MKNRDMFYQNLNQGYQNPGQFVPPSGYNMNSQYQAYGPNVMPGQAYGPNVVPGQMNQYNDNYTDEYEQRISKLERQVKNLDTRLQKLETANTEGVTDNIYMI